MKEDCCTYNCEQGKNCPVRATRRVRAGQPAPPILLDPDDWEREEEELPSWLAILIVIALMLIVAALAAGWVAVL
jgi:hypothetical protein